MAPKSKRPKDGSRKAEVWDVFQAKGAEAAIKKALSFDEPLQEGTARSWVKEWARAEGTELDLPSSSGKPAKTIKKDKTDKKGSTAPVKRERLDTKDDPDEKFNPAFKYTTRDACETALIQKAKAAGLRPWTYHIIEHNGRFAIAPAHYKAKGPIPQFKKGDVVYDCYLVNSEAEVIEAGPEQCVVRYVLPYKNRPNEQCVPNRYLVAFDGTPSVVPKKVKTETEIKTSSTHALKAHELKIRKTKGDKKAPAKREKLEKPKTKGKKGKK